MHHLTRDQVRQLLQAIPSPRHRTAVLVSYTHGLRVSEATALRVKDVANGYIIVPRLKGSLKTEQRLYASSDLVFDEVTHLEAVISQNNLGANDLLFPYHRTYLWKIMKLAALKAGIPSHLAHPHVLKHSIARFMIKRSGIEETRMWLGHRSLASTGEYLILSDEEASAAATRAFREADEESLTRPPI